VNTVQRQRQADALRTSSRPANWKSPKQIACGLGLCASGGLTDRHAYGGAGHL